jgi:hypothetical protein
MLGYDVAVSVFTTGKKAITHRSMNAIYKGF